MRLPQRAARKARIEIIPMIDIIFFLLVFFMISTLSMTINRGLPVNLPAAASAQKDLHESLNITVTRDWEIFLNKAPITLLALNQHVKAALDKDTALLAIITADGHTLHGVVVEIMDTLRLAGISRLAIAVKPGRTSQP